MNETTLVFVTGKGGVGKSTMAALVAQNYAKEGKKTLLVEVGDSSYYQHLFRVDVGFTPLAVQSNFYVAHWQWFRCLKEYVTHVIKLESLTNLFFENAITKSIIQVAPGIPEIALLGKFTSGIRHVGPPLPFDVVILDAPATGHALSMLRAPKAMFDTIGFGPLGEHSKGIYETLINPTYCRYITVCLPEELPVTETIEFTSTLQKEFSIASEVWLNKVLPLHFDSHHIPMWKEQVQSTSALSFIKYIEGQEHKQQQSIRALKAACSLTKQFLYRSLEKNPLEWLQMLEREARDA